MGKYVALVLTLLCISLKCEAQTPQSILQSATAYQGLPDQDLAVISAYSLTLLAIGVVSPSQAMAAAAAYQGLDDRDLQIVQTYCLAQMAGAPVSIGEALANTRVGTTRGQNYKISVPTNFLYIASGEGIVRSIEFTSSGVNNLDIDARTNRSLRIYADSGTINFGAPTLNLPAGNLVAEIPYYSIMCCKYWPAFSTNIIGPLAFGTRYVGWVECPSNSAVAAGASHFTYTLRYPMPFTNGIAIVPWDNGANTFTNGGFSFVNYELGTLPQPIRNYRLRTSHTVTNYPNPSANNSPILLTYTGAGEVMSVFVSSTNSSGNGDLYWDGVWKQQPDGIAAPEAFGCAGGEDMFNNGSFFDGGANSTWDWGTRYLNKIPGQNYFVEAYRHFYGSDSHHWNTNQSIFWAGTGDAIGDFDCLIIFYGK